MGCNPIVFLDIDGVLNGEYVSGGESLTTALIKRLNRIVIPTLAEVVLSSSWRKLYRVSDVEDQLRNRGYEGRLDGVTPALGGPRGGNIASYLRDYPARYIRGYGSVVILDDSSDIAPLEHRHVKTDVRFGLREQDVDAALKIIAGDPFDPEVELG